MATIPPPYDQPSWLKISQKKIELQADAISSFKSVDHTSHYDSITAIGDISKLATLIENGDLRVYDVTLAFIQKYVVLPFAGFGQTFNETEILFEAALQRAKQLDEYQATHGKTIGPLHGVPMTLKDQFNVKGYDTTLGYVGRAFKPAVEDADLVRILGDAGVVFIAKTNLPQSIMWCETENPLWGLTTNPNNPDFTPGGSTGGESALLALHGSTLGWGTDIGGSVRIPAHMMGLYGFKPSSGRLPYAGVPVSTEGQEHVPSSVGPIGRSLSSIYEVTRLIIEAQPWNNDPRAHRLPWSEQEYRSIQSRPLVMGVLLDDGVVKVHPPIERIVEEAVAKLEAAGHTILPWNADGHAECIEVMDQYYTADGGEDIKRDVAAGGEPFLPHVQALVSRGPAISVYEYWALNQKKRAAQRAYLKKWQAIRCPETGRNVDVLLMPVMPHAAVRHRACKWVGYTKVWNLLDNTALVIPGGKVDQDIDLPRDDPAVVSYEPRNDLDKWNWDLYDPVLGHGMPVGLQIVGRRLEEEKVLGAAKVIESVLR